MRTRIAGGLAIAAVAGGIVSAAPASPLDWLGDFMTDAATRLARDLREGAERLGASREPTISVTHRMKRSPEGCADGYRVQFSAASAIVVWCRSPGGERTVSSHTTTSHLPAVDVPRTWIVDKGPGEPLVVEMARTNGRPVVTGVH